MFEPHKEQLDNIFPFIASQIKIAPPQAQEFIAENIPLRRLRDLLEVVYEEDSEKNVPSIESLITKIQIYHEDERTYELEKAKLSDEAKVILSSIVLALIAYIVLTPIQYIPGASETSCGVSMVGAGIYLNLWRQFLLRDKKNSVLKRLVELEQEEIFRQIHFVSERYSILENSPEKFIEVVITFLQATPSKHFHSA
jgi:hypothetical protein